MQSSARPSALSSKITHPQREVRACLLRLLSGALRGSIAGPSCLALLPIALLIKLGANLLVSSSPLLHSEMYVHLTTMNDPESARDIINNGKTAPLSTTSDGRILTGTVPSSSRHASSQVAHGEQPALKDGTLLF